MEVTEFRHLADYYAPRNMTRGEIHDWVFARWSLPWHWFALDVWDMHWVMRIGYSKTPPLLCHKFCR